MRLLNGLLDKDFFNTQVSLSYTFCTWLEVYRLSAFADGTLDAHAAVGPGGPGQVGPVQAGIAQAGPGQIGPGQVCIPEIGPGKVGIAEVCPAQVCAAQAGPGQVGSAQVGPVQAGTGKIGPAQVGPGKIRPAKIGPGKVALGAGFGLTEGFQVLLVEGLDRTGQQNAGRDDKSQTRGLDNTFHVFPPGLENNHPEPSWPAKRILRVQDFKS